MTDYMILEGKLLSDKEVRLAIARAHVMRSEFIWKLCQAAFAKVSNLFHPHTQEKDSELAHSA